MIVAGVAALLVVLLQTVRLGLRALASPSITIGETGYDPWWRRLGDKVLYGGALGMAIGGLTWLGRGLGSSLGWWSVLHLDRYPEWIYFAGCVLVFTSNLVSHLHLDISRNRVEAADAAARHARQP